MKQALVEQCTEKVREQSVRWPNHTVLKMIVFQLEKDTKFSKKGNEYISFNC